MKTKQIVQLVVAILILAIASYIVYALAVPNKGGGKTVTYVKVTPIDPNFDTTSLNQLSNSSNVRDFYNPPNLNSGLNNSQPFGPLQ